LRPLESFQDSGAPSKYRDLSLPARLLKHKFSEEKKPFPSLSQLEHDNVKAQVLHFFANHELLALELMALALLRFPDAPKAFRRSLVTSMQEEQEHMRFYLDNMQRFGWEFGDAPLSGFFWNCIQGGNTALDFVCHLNLCFEQANLDYSKYFERQFRRIEDHSIADALQQVYEDEIKHVGIGLHWFRKWKPQGQTDWQAHKSSLRLPLSLRRAKGKDFMREAREKIGFEKDYIDRLQVFSSSRGKIANVYHFNPDAESRVGGKNSNKILLHLQQDLAFLMNLLCDESDILLLQNLPTKEYLKEMQALGLPIAEYRSDIPENRKVNLSPWAKEDPYLLSKMRTKEFLDRFYENFQHPLLLDRTDLLSEDLRAKELLAKPIYACSGRGIKTGRQDGNYLYEKRFHVKKNISFHFKRTEVGVKYLGCTEFFTNRFQFSAAVVNQKDFPLNCLLREDSEFYKSLVRTYTHILHDYLPANYQGPVSLDTFITEDLKFHPCNDLNIRFTMGRIANRLKKYISPASSASLEIVKKENYQKQDMVTNNKKQMVRGCIALSDPEIAKVFLPILKVQVGSKISR